MKRQKQSDHLQSFINTGNEITHQPQTGIQWRDNPGTIPQALLSDLDCTTTDKFMPDHCTCPFMTPPIAEYDKKRKATQKRNLQMNIPHQNTQYGCGTKQCCTFTLQVECWTGLSNKWKWTLHAQNTWDSLWHNKREKWSGDDKNKIRIHFGSSFSVQG